jgi:hypothetical protein
VLFGRMQRDLLALSAGSAGGLSAGLIQKLADPQNLLEPATRALIPETLLGPLVGILRASIWQAFVAGLFIMLIGLAVSLRMPAPTAAVFRDGHRDR